MASRRSEVPEQMDASLPPPSSTTTTSPFAFAPAFSFRFYFTISISLLAVVLPYLLLSPALPHPILSLPPPLRDHFSRGRLLQLYHQPSPSRSPTHLFAISTTPCATIAAADPVLIIPGLAASSFSFRHVLGSLAARGLCAWALDLPGSGFSDTPPPTRSVAPPNPLWGIYHEIKQKGVFFAFDQLIETGEIPYQEKISSPTAADLSPYSSSEMAGLIGDAVSALGLAHFHLVLHDSALGAGASFVSANPSAVRSVTLLDSAAGLPAFPSALLGVPVVGELVLRCQPLFTGLLRLCCSRSMEGEVAEAHRVILRGDGKRKALFEAWKALNYSFELKEWKASEAVKEVPVMMLWSNGWSDRWIDEGRRAASAIPDAKFVYHSGGRWPQEDAAEEITKTIAEFVTSLPRSVKQQSEEFRTEHIEQPFAEAKCGQEELQHPNHKCSHIQGHGQDHGHGHAVGHVECMACDETSPAAI